MVVVGAGFAGLGGVIRHTSQVFMIEAQIARAIAAVTKMRSRGLRTLEVRSGSSAGSPPTYAAE